MEKLREVTTCTAYASASSLKTSFNSRQKVHLDAVERDEMGRRRWGKRAVEEERRVESKKIKRLSWAYNSRKSLSQQIR